MLKDCDNGDVFSRYGLRRIINVSGTETTMGASPVAEEIIATVQGLLPHWVDMGQLQSVACRTIARAFGTEAGCVVNCSAAGISMAVAGAMTGRNLALVERLPDTIGLRNEVILQRGHNVNYGGYISQHIAITGARIVEIGAATECGAYHLEAAISPQTAAAIFVVSPHAVSHGLIDLPTMVVVCHRHGVPVILDIAAEPDPRMFLKTGVDLSISSVHKQFAGVTAGIVAGRLDLVQACLYQEKGIGRPMKIGKEGVIGTISAVERWETLDRAHMRSAADRRLARAKERLDTVGTLSVTIEPDPTSGLYSRLHIQVDAARVGTTAHAIAAALWSQTPSIAVRSLFADTGLLQVDLQRVDDKTAEHVVDSIERIVREAGSQPGKERSPEATGTANAADNGAAALALWPQ